MGDLSDEVRLGLALRGGRADTTHGIKALNGDLLPDELVMALEEADCFESAMTEDEVRREVLSVLIKWFYSDSRPEEPLFVAARLYCFVSEYFPAVLSGYDVFIDYDLIGSMPSRGSGALSLSEVGNEIFGSEVNFGIKYETAKGVLDYLFEDGKFSDPVVATRRVYALAKSYWPEMIDGASLHMLGVWFGEGDDERRHRARWSARIKVWVSSTVSDAGFVGKQKFQKSATASRSYSRAQIGNKNRLGK